MNHYTKITKPNVENNDILTCKEIRIVSKKPMNDTVKFKTIFEPLQNGKIMINSYAVNTKNKKSSHIAYCCIPAYRAVYILNEIIKKYNNKYDGSFKSYKVEESPLEEPIDFIFAIGQVQIAFPEVDEKISAHSTYVPKKSACKRNPAKCATKKMIGKLPNFKKNFRKVAF